VLHCPGGTVEPDPDVCARLAEVLDMQRMQESVARLSRPRSCSARCTRSPTWRAPTRHARHAARLHRIVSDLMYAENFYIAMYDRERDSLRFMYFADVVDPNLLGQEEEVPLSRIEQGLTWYLTRDKKPLMGSTEELVTQVSGPLRLHGFGPAATGWACRCCAMAK
jgi:hypothetical protein